MNYKEAILKMIQTLNDETTLKLIYHFLNSFIS